MAVYGYIYKIWHIVDGKLMIYIGLTKQTVKRRWAAHKCVALRGDGTMPIHRAIYRYGHETFQVATLHTAFSKEELSKLEIQEIALHNSCNRAFGYNVFPGGSTGALGLRHSEETRAKMSVTRKGRKHTPEWNARIGDSHRGMKATEEARARMSEAQRGEKHRMFGRHLPAETRARIGEANRGKRHSAVIRAKIGDANRGRKWSPGQCEKMSEAWRGEGNPNFGKHLSEDTRARISGKNHYLFGRRPSAETCAKLSAANRGKKRSAESCVRMSEAKRGENHPMFGKHLTVEHRSKLSEANRGKRRSAETCAKIGAAHKGKTVSLEQRAKLSAFMKQSHSNNPRTISPETRRKMADSRRGMPQSAQAKKRRAESPISPETRLRISEASFAREAKKRLARRLAES